MEALAGHARQVTAARCLWLETQNVNYPAVQFYLRLGFELCGLDQTLYAPGPGLWWQDAGRSARRPRSPSRDRRGSLLKAYARRPPLM